MGGAVVDLFENAADRLAIELDHSDADDGALVVFHRLGKIDSGFLAGGADQQIGNVIFPLDGFPVVLPVIVFFGDDLAVGGGDEDAFRLGDPALGVVYVQDSQCVERAGAFIFNYVNPND